MQPSTLIDRRGYNLAMNRAAFTLIEMLVVVAIIAVLAGILIPTVGVVRRLVKDMNCGSNLRQIGAAIEVYKQQNDDRFPAHLIGGTGTTMQSTDDLVHRDGPLQGLTKIFVCPRDGNFGKERNMGRPPRVFTGDPLDYLYDSGIVAGGTTAGSSYLFEANGYQLQSGQFGWFYTRADREPFSRRTNPEPAPTWAQAKYNQLMNGNPDTGGTVYSGRFPPALFPIIRCFWHNQWTTQNRRTTKKVKNVSWELNVFESIPYWEHEANPDIAIPN
jgi:prepilin-type N-terminal cleavage/methylation domain-containing protein